MSTYRTSSLKHVQDMIQALNKSNPLCCAKYRAIALPSSGTHHNYGIGVYLDVNGDLVRKITTADVSEVR